ncbi:DUF305 domain-containing protein [Qipengyuania atrilutea]|uniref:DUF305 domain-containing protein n=1 Tax=Qipengyuania atrilutea TaxID=2744473 RepID=A0A850H318_9SPHN|nr:DUF305 domain-containing protein [Actirhodobacter atriluteus]NVD45066.1 DUF305 domain-containing protein [Actirhodobacter atriluteus]
MTFRRLALALAGSSLAALATAASAQDAPIVQPGAPGAAPRTISSDEAVKLAESRYSPADVKFLQYMIPHHAQALTLSNLVDGRSNNPVLTDVAERIEAGQMDEIEFMRDWLRSRGQPLEADMHAAHHAGGTMHMADGLVMTGMATPADIEELSNLQGTAFERKFLTLMIAHHRGAIDMVDWLLEQSGSAYDPVLLEFVNGVRADQVSEVDKMNARLSTLSSDKRASLAAGFRDAGQAAWNMTLEHALPKPAGFFDPANPAGLQPLIESGDDEEEEDSAEAEREEREAGSPDFGQRGSFLSFANTDMAFSGDMLVAGNYHGFNIYRLAEGGEPQLVSSVVCPGGQGDVSVVGNLLIMSVEQTSGRVDCGIQGIEEDVSEDRFRGLRIFDISDVTRPMQVGQVQTCRGSHTHSVVTLPENNNGRIVVYNSGTSSVRDEEELAGCVGDVPGDSRTALFRIDVIEIPVDNPSAARIVSSPAVFADPESGNLAGLWRGGDHGAGTQDSRRTDQCHDITVFPTANLAAGACSGNGIIFDITEPLEPKRIDAVTDDGFAYWHSATFNNEGTKVLFTDEWGGGARARCRAYDDMSWGADAIYDIEGGQLERRGTYKLPAPQGDKENCVAHNGSIVPVPGRDIMVQAWYQGGLSIFDFTDSQNPREIAYFDRGPIDEDQLVLGGYWSAYFYDGKIYGTEIARGLDVLSLEPSEYLTENEIAAASLATTGEAFNPQRQLPVTWPAQPVVGLAYLDQLERGGAANASDIAAMRAALGRPGGPTASEVAAAKRMVAGLTGRDAERGAALVGVMEALARAS